MAKKFNDPTVTGLTTVPDAYRYMVFNGSTGEVYYQTRTNLQSQNQGQKVRFSTDTVIVASSANAFGRWTYTGTGGHTLTIPDDCPGVLYLFNSGSGNLTLSATLNSNMLTTIGPGSGRILWWDGTEYVGIS